MMPGFRTMTPGFCRLGAGPSPARLTLARVTLAAALATATLAAATLGTVLSPSHHLSAQVSVEFPHGTFPEGLSCLDCHTSEGWRPIRAVVGFDHGELTGFPLQGSHASVYCTSCHQDLHFEKAQASPQECGTCHTDVHRGSLPANCALCHTPTSFQDLSGLRIHQGTSFPLEGAHLQVSCESCHSDDEGGAFAPLSTECLACHREDYEASSVVDHVQLGFPSTCLTCHTPRAWMDIGAFDHAAFSGGVQLQGAHQRAPCAACHTQGGGLRFQPTGPEDCAACHQSDYQREHGGSGFPQNCVQCHNQESWEREDFDHLSESGGYALTGPHGELACTSCHTSDGAGTLFQPSSTNDCVACHQGDFQEEHAGMGFPTVCLDCHTPNTWSGVTIDHLALSNGFELLGDHGLLACTSCHTPDGSGTLFQPSAPDDCVSCHQAAFQEEHAGSGYPTACLDCHTLNSWDGAVVDHLALSDGFALPADHGLLACTSCHTPDGSGTLFQPTAPDDCVACHQADYQREHSGSGYPTLCTQCHTTSSWEGVSGDHTVFSGGFELLGDHGLLACTSCHTPDGAGTLFQPTAPDDCVACHQANYDQQHAGSGYPTECLGCHTITTWDGAVADHLVLSGGFALPADHGLLACTSCHTPDGSATLFQPTAPDDCVACHQADYQREHSGSEYPTLCTQCHTTSSWGGVSGDHVTLSGGFELLGNHGLLACTSCHTPDGSATLFQPTTPEDCVACHQANYDQQHAGSGYPTECLSCHTIDTWTGASSDHETISGGFTLVGNHGLLACTSCHIVPGMEPLFTPTDPEDCLACHLGDFQREHSGQSYPTTCLTCHVVTSWGGARFNHDADFFPIYSGKHQGLWDSCQTCHTNPSNYALFTCFNCHKHNQTDTNRDHSEVSGYAYESTLCLSCHPSPQP